MPYVLSFLQYFCIIYIVVYLFGNKLFNDEFGIWYESIINVFQYVFLFLDIRNYYHKQTSLFNILISIRVTV